MNTHELSVLCVCRTHWLACFLKRFYFFYFQYNVVQRRYRYIFSRPTDYLFIYDCYRSAHIIMLVFLCQFCFSFLVAFILSSNFFIFYFYFIYFLCSFVYEYVFFHNFPSIYIAIFHLCLSSLQKTECFTNGGYKILKTGVIIFLFGFWAFFAFFLFCLDN